MFSSTIRTDAVARAAAEHARPATGAFAGIRRERVPQTERDARQRGRGGLAGIHTLRFP